MNNHILILGNGFDLFLGRKTSYKSFYNQLGSKITNFPSLLIDHLNQFTNERGEKARWYDLENEFLRFYENLLKTGYAEFYNNIEGFIINNIKTYSVPWTYIVDNCRKVSANSFNTNELINAAHELSDRGIVNLDSTSISLVDEIYAQKDDVRDFEAFKTIKSELCEYIQKATSDYNKEKFKEFKDSDLLKNCPISEVYSFNYSKTPFDDLGVKVSYIHGSCENRNIILGTREDEKFEHRKEYRFLQKTFDNKYNPVDIITALNNQTEGDVVTFFGHSLGINDKSYFADFFKKQSIQGQCERLNVNFIFYEEDNLPDIKHAIQQMTNYHLGDFLCKNNVNYYTTKDGFAKYNF